MRKDLDERTLKRLMGMYDIKRNENESNSDLIKRITIKAEKIENDSQIHGYFVK